MCHPKAGKIQAAPMPPIMPPERNADDGERDHHRPPAQGSELGGERACIGKRTAGAHAGDQA